VTRFVSREECTSAELAEKERIGAPRSGTDVCEEPSAVRRAIGAKRLSADSGSAGANAEEELVVHRERSKAHKIAEAGHVLRRATSGAEVSDESCSLCGSVGRP